MDDTKAKLANRLKEANNVLISVTNNPSVDQFAAAIAVTLILNKLGKHATTVFSGTIPSTIEFLKPETIVEKNTDSLRDFIISLDKSKADKLRYKIEDNFVKIFITPYHSSIGEKDLVFSQGDFNVDVVLGLGVHQREELDQAITAHGRILHDATVMTINTQPPSNLGSINWSDSKSSSICEMIVFLSDLLAKQGLFDTQISNALLTGIVAETQRFSNQKTTSSTMEASSKLLASGANQQLVATELTPKPAPVPVPVPKPQEQKPSQPEAKTNDPASKSSQTDKKPEDGEIKIEHEGQPSVTQVLIDDQGELKRVGDDNNAKEPNAPVPEAMPEPPSDDQSSNVEPPQPPPPPTVPEPPQPTYVPPPLIPLPPDPSLDDPTPLPQPTVPEPPAPSQPSSLPPPDPQAFSPPPPPDSPPAKPINLDMSSSGNSFLNGPKLVLEPPSLSGQLNANENGLMDDEGFPDPLSLSPASSSPQPTPLLEHNSGPALPVAPPQPQPSVMPLQASGGTMPNLDEVRSAVDFALSSTPPNISNQPLASLNAQPINLNLAQPQAPSLNPLTPQNNPIIQPTTPPSPPSTIISPVSAPPNAGQSLVPPPANSAPPVPPPIIPLNDNNLPPSFTAL